MRKELASMAMTPGELEALSVSELQRVLQDRGATIAELEEEIAHLESVSGEFEARLEHLESTLGDVGPNDVIKVRRLALLGTGDAMQEESDTFHRHATSHRQDEVDPPMDLASLRSTRFVLGRGYLPLDEPPPVQGPEHLRASGRYALFVGPAGMNQRRPLRQMPPNQTFWLDAPPAH
uniref:Uncharacterized protein n=1 Tax=Pyrodinium bahamense TaxID=73915 RepID=A0A7S0A1L2_9DINO|mmetsp:Transcript_18957/g.52237  ORF Transcript_18957/g.52237 Transcript_18957/m.52237 type:complete len:178 (+) Transcript_18957:112-645(+)